MQLSAFTPHNERAFCAYVSQALRNRLRDAVRRAGRQAGRRGSVDRKNQPPIRLRSNRPSAFRCSARYDAALQRLREAIGELVVARVELGLGYDEIADLLDKPSIPAARVAVSRALVRLASEMGVERHA